MKTKHSQIARTNVWYGKKAFLVSTINRPCSATVCGDMYAETLAWEWEAGTGVIHEQVAQGEDEYNSISTHQCIVQQLHCTGECRE